MELFLFPWGWGVLCRGQHHLVRGAVWARLLPGTPGDGTHDRVFILHTLWSRGCLLSAGFQYEKEKEAQEQAQQGHGASASKSPSDQECRLPWQQQDRPAPGPMDVQSLAAEAEAGAEPFVEAQGAVGPGPSGAGGDLEGGIAEVPLQQPFAQPPAQGGGRPGLGGAAAAQTLVLLGAGGAQQLWGGEHEEAQGGILGAQRVLSPAAELCFCSS